MSEGSRKDARPRAKLSPWVLLLGLGLVAIGVFVSWRWFNTPNGHTGRRLVTGLAALLVGGAVTFLSFGQACSVCGNVLASFRYQASGDLRQRIERFLVDGDASGAAGLLRQTMAAQAPERTSRGEGEGQGDRHSLAYCDGCRGLLVIETAGGGGPRGARGGRGAHLVTGGRALAVVPVLQELVRDGHGRP